MDKKQPRFKAGDHVLVLIQHECGNRCEATHEQRRALVVAVAPCIYDRKIWMYLTTADNLWCAWMLEEDLQSDPETRSIGIKIV